MRIHLISELTHAKMSRSQGLFIVDLNSAFVPGTLRGRAGGREANCLRDCINHDDTLRNIARSRVNGKYLDPHFRVSKAFVDFSDHLGSCLQSVPEDGLVPCKLEDILLLGRVPVGPERKELRIKTSKHLTQKSPVWCT